MKKTLILPLALSLMLAVNTNAAFSAPAKTPEMPKTLIYQLTDKEKADFKAREERKAEFDKLSPEEKKEKMQKMHQQRAQDFETKLGLTEAQKEKAKEIRLKGRKEVKPIFEKMKAKNDEIAAVAKSRLAPKAQEQKIKKLQKELIALKGEADKLRKKNMAEFESMLTADQKKILEEMKAEGKKRHEAAKQMNKGGRAPFGGEMSPPPQKGLEKK